MKIFSIITLFFYCLSSNCMESNTDPFTEQINALSRKTDKDLNSQNIKKWGEFEIYINEDGSVKRKTDFQSDQPSAENNSYPPAMGSYLTDEYLIQAPSDKWFGQIICWWNKVVMKKAVRLALSSTNNFLLAEAHQKYFEFPELFYPFSPDVDSKLLALMIVNLKQKTTEEVPLPKMIPGTWHEVETAEEARISINKGYSFIDYINNKYILMNGKINAMAISNDGTKIALANNSLIALMEKKEATWETKNIKELDNNYKILKLNKNYKGEPAAIYWPQKVAFLQFNDQANKLAVGYYKKDPEPLSRRDYIGLCNINRSPKETEIIDIPDLRD